MRLLCYRVPWPWWRYQPDTCSHHVADGHYGLDDLQILADVRRTWCEAERFHIYRPAGMP